MNSRGLVVLEAMWCGGRGQKEESLTDGSYQLSIPLSHHAEIMMQVLGHGSHVTVMEPDWLRSLVTEEIGKMGELYQ